MNKVKLLKSFMSVLLLMITALALPENAVADYASSCLGCHGAIKAGGGTAGASGPALSSSMSGSQIRTAINANKGGMSFLSTLTDTQLAAIATEVAPPPVACAGNNYSASGKAPCTPCPTGGVINATHTACPVPPAAPVACAGNNYSATGNTPCTPCPTGGVINATHTACPVPPAAPVACAGNNYSATGKTPCTPCPTGQQANAGHTACVVPPAPPAMTSVSGGVGLAKSGAARTDVYAVTCAAGTKDLSVSVMDKKPVKAPLISIQASKDGASSGLSTDSVDGDDKYSPVVSLAKGAGIYMMNVNKSAARVACKNDDDDDEDDDDSHNKCYVIGPETYTAQFACRNAAGIKTGTTYRQKQNH